MLSIFRKISNKFDKSMYRIKDEYLKIQIDTSVFELRNSEDKTLELNNLTEHKTGLKLKLVA